MDNIEAFTTGSVIVLGGRVSMGSKARYVYSPKKNSGSLNQKTTNSPTKKPYVNSKKLDFDTEDSDMSEEEKPTSKRYNPEYQPESNKACLKTPLDRSIPSESSFDDEVTNSTYS